MMNVELVTQIREIRNRPLEFNETEDRTVASRKVVEEIDRLVIVEEASCYFEPESEHVDSSTFLVAVTKSGRNLKLMEVNLPPTEAEERQMEEVAVWRDDLDRHFGIPTVAERESKIN